MWKEVKEVTGNDFHGPPIVDGWKVYSYLTILQRCWAHLNREVDAFKSLGKGKELSEEIHSMFKKLKKSLESEDIDQRRSVKVEFDRSMDDIVKRYDPHGELHKRTSPLNT